MAIQDDIQTVLGERWQNRDLSELANSVTKAMMHDTGDWDPPAGIEPARPLVRMSIGIPDATTVPRHGLLDGARQVTEEPGEAPYIYGFGMGYTRLRMQLATRFTREKGLQVGEDHFQLTNGSAGAIDLICRTLIDPGDVIICESPTYMGTLRNFRGVQAEVIAVPMDDDGMDMTALATTIAQLRAAGKRIKLIYTIATFHNPTGATLSLERRLSLLKLAADNDILILDDDAYGDLYFAEKPPLSLASLAGGHGVLTVGTLSKTLAPGLRTGWIQGQPELVALFGKMRFAMGLNQFMVRAISRYVEDSFDEHVQEVRSLYARKMNILADALQASAGEHLSFSRPAGGFYLWVNLRQLDAGDVWRTAMAEGVGITPGVNFYVSREDPGQHLRIAFAWTPEDQLLEGARRIGLACERVARGDAAVPVDG